jgi:hypothetical protein
MRSVKLHKTSCISIYRVFHDLRTLLQEVKHSVYIFENELFYDNGGSTKETTRGYCTVSQVS